MANTSYGIFEPDSDWPNTYLLVLGLFAVANAAIFTLNINLWHNSINMVVYYHALVDYFGGAAPFSILKAALVTEGWRSIMLLSERIRYKLKKEAHEEGLAEGLEQGREEERRKYAIAIASWYERMRDALERGEDFDEPPPGLKR